MANGFVTLHISSNATQLEALQLEKRKPIRNSQNKGA